MRQTLLCGSGGSREARLDADPAEGVRLPVVEQTDNGTDALGAIIAEQPDLVLVGDRLSMMPT